MYRIYKNSARVQKCIWSLQRVNKTAGAVTMKKQYGFEKLSSYYGVSMSRKARAKEIVFKVGWWENNILGCCFSY